MTGENGVPETPDWQPTSRPCELARIAGIRTAHNLAAEPYEDTAALPERFELGEN